MPVGLISKKLATYMRGYRSKKLRKIFFRFCETKIKNLRVLGALRGKKLFVLRVLCKKIKKEFKRKVAKNAKNNKRKICNL